jgi:nucleoside-diphosphate-sugar epimerase
MYCRQYSVLYGLETVALRFFNVYGPRQDRASEYGAVIPSFVASCRKGEAPIVYGDGKQTRDFVYVGDAIEAVVSAVEGAAGTGSVFNVATGRPTSLLELLSEIQALTGAVVPARHERVREGDVRHSTANVSKAREILEFEPAIGLREGLRRSLAEEVER